MLLRLSIKAYINNMSHSFLITQTIRKNGGAPCSPFLDDLEKVSIAVKSDVLIGGITTKGVVLCLKRKVNDIINQLCQSFVSSDI